MAKIELKDKTWRMLRHAEHMCLFLYNGSPEYGYHLWRQNTIRFSKSSIFSRTIREVVMKGTTDYWQKPKEWSIEKKPHTLYPPFRITATYTLEQNVADPSGYRVIKAHATALINGGYERIELEAPVRQFVGEDGTIEDVYPTFEWHYNKGGWGTKVPRYYRQNDNHRIVELAA